RPAPAGGVTQLPRTAVCALVVDNDDDVREGLARLLEAAGLTAVVEASAETALERLRRDPVDLFLLDVDAAGMLATLRATPGLADLPVLLLAGPDQHAAALRVLETGADDFVPKPIDAAVLRVRIGGLLRRR